jgi:lipopolysaccharide transport system permease protein
MSDSKPTYVVEADKLLSSNPKELWAYRELFRLLVKRDFVAVYKQTVLGPLWFFVQPFLASLVFMVVFGQIARLRLKITQVGCTFDWLFQSQRT